MAEEFEGGQGDGLPDDEFDPEQLEKGVEEERKEHGFDRKGAKETAKDHLAKDRKYYDHLEKMEKAVKNESRIPDLVSFVLGLPTR